MDYSHVTDSAPVIDYLFKKLSEELATGKKVLWLLTGGSGIATEVAVSKLLANQDLSRLSITLTDERFGPVGHPDENWQQMLDQGFALPNADLYRPLQDLDRDATTEAFSNWLHDRINNTDFKIGFFGLGTDGHTAGIKPHSPAITETEWASGYTGPDFERITMTFPAIKHLDEAVMQAMGPDKSPVVYELLNNDSISLDDQPAQVLKQVKQSILFTDHLEGKE